MDGSVPFAGGRVAYRDLGGPGPAVILLHGLGGNLAHWGRVAPLIQDRYRVVSIDLPSHGASSAMAEHSFEHDVSAVDEVRRHLDLDLPAVVGHSYGGMLAVALGAIRPTDYRTVVNVDGIGFVVDDADEQPSPPDDLPEEALVSSGDDEWLEREIGRDLDETSAMGLGLDGDDEILRRAYQRGDDGLWRRSPSAQQFVGINKALDGLRLLPFYTASACRTLTVVAERRDAPTEEMAASRRRHAEKVRALLNDIGAELDTVPTGHYPHVEAPAMTADRLSSWVGF
jgi:pimeloyl-ACP methyl ester carboxylesterase